MLSCFKLLIFENYSKAPFQWARMLKSVKELRYGSTLFFCKGYMLSPLNNYYLYKSCRSWLLLLHFSTLFKRWYCNVFKNAIKFCNWWSPTGGKLENDFKYFHHKNFPGSRTDSFLDISGGNPKLIRGNFAFNPNFLVNIAYVI